MNRILSTSMVVIFLLIITFNAISQTHKRIGVIGSSTSYGYFGNPPAYPRDSGWAFKIQKYYKDAGVADTVYNLAVVSADCYNGMPTSYIPPSGRNQPDPVHNITAILNRIPKPDVVVVNYPTNNYDWLPNNEIIQCLQTIKDSANAQNVRCYITTTQPRNNFSSQEQQKLKDLQSLIQIQFGQWAIDFWSDVVSDDSYLINPVYSLGDGIHLNPAGQTVLEQKVISAHIFGTVILPVQLTDFEVSKKSDAVVLHWSYAPENGTIFKIEKSTDGVQYNTIETIAGDGNMLFTFTDNSPSQGTDYYRVCITGSNGQQQYSEIKEINFEHTALTVSSVIPSVSNNRISFTVSTATAKQVTIQVSNLEGKQVYADIYSVNDKVEIVKDISKLQPGLYFINIFTNNEAVQRKFIKQ